MRQRLWLVVAIAGLVLLVAIPNIQAVDASAQLKLSVAMTAGTVGFVAMLLAMLIGAVYVRRDLDSRIGFIAFRQALGSLAICPWALVRFAAAYWCGHVISWQPWGTFDLVADRCFTATVGRCSSRTALGHSRGEALPVSRTRTRSWLTGTRSLAVVKVFDGNLLD